MAVGEGGVDGGGSDGVALGPVEEEEDDKKAAEADNGALAAGEGGKEQQQQQQALPYEDASEDDAEEAYIQATAAGDLRDSDDDDDGHNGGGGGGSAAGGAGAGAGGGGRSLSLLSRSDVFAQSTDSFWSSNSNVSATSAASPRLLGKQLCRPLLRNTATRRSSSTTFGYALPDPECLFARLAVSGWSPKAHRLHHRRIRTAVWNVLLCASRMDCKAFLYWQARGGDGDGGDGSGDAHDDVPLTLPPEMWLAVLACIARSDWEPPSLTERANLAALSICDPWEL